MTNSFGSASTGIKLIRFFRIIGVVGGMVLLIRVLLLIAVLSGILYSLP